MIRLLTPPEVERYRVDDTVRPHLSTQFRTTAGRSVWGLFEDKYSLYDEPSADALAVICTAYTTAVPTNEQELDLYSQAAHQGGASSSVAVFYTVWSYERGAGQAVVNGVAEHIAHTRPSIRRWVTLSPLTRMAERFHLKNGAVFVDRYEENQTFEYTHLFAASVE